MSISSFDIPDISTVDNVDGLPVTIVDPTATWSRLHLPSMLPLGHIDLLRRSHGVDVKESTSSAKARLSVQSSLPAEEVPCAPYQWFAEPYVYVYVVELSTLDGKESDSAWKALGNFITWCREREVQFLVIYPADDLALKQYRKAVGRIRSEVTSAKEKQRAVGVVPTKRKEELDVQQEGYQIPSSYHELVVVLSEFCGNAVRKRALRYEEEAALLYANRRTSGWKYTHYFALKEGLAFLFLQVRRLDLTLKQYDELLSHPFVFETFCNPTDGSDGASILTSRDMMPKFRSLLLRDAINELDFRSYVFSCQASLLLRERKHLDLAERGIKFMASIMRRLGEQSSAKGNGKLLDAPLFKDAWVFSAARSIAKMVTPAIPLSATSEEMLPSQLPTPRERHTARLLAGYYVHALKSFTCLCKRVLPNDFWPPELTDGPLDTHEKHSAEAISNKALRDALFDRSKAEELYSELAYSAASLYEMGGRDRGAAALDGDCGLVRLKNGSLEEAKRLLEAQCSRFSDDSGWDQLHRRRRTKLAKVEMKLNRLKDYLLSCLTLLSMYREDRRLALVASGGTDDLNICAKEAQYWANEATDTASKLPHLMKYKAEKLVVVKVKPNISPWSAGEEGQCTVTIESNIPATLNIDLVRLHLEYHGCETRSSGFRRVESKEEKRNAESSCALKTLQLSSKDMVPLSAGSTDIIVSSELIPHAGRYNITSVSLFLGKLKLVQEAGELNVAPTVVAKGRRKQANGTGLPIDSARFPAMFSLAKTPETTLEFRHSQELYAAPQMIQIVKIRVCAGPCGIAKGAKLCANIIPTGRDTDVLLSSAVFCPRRSYICNPDSLNTVVPTNQADEGDVDSEWVELVTPMDVVPNGGFMLNLALKVTEACSHSVSFILHVVFVHFELEASDTREFRLTEQALLNFALPVNSVASFRLSETLNVEPSGLMGTFQVGIQSNVRKLIIHAVDLDGPSWMEPIGSPPHISLLPCRLMEGGLFVCAWDVHVHPENIHDLGRGESGLRVQRVHSHSTGTADIVLGNGGDQEHEGQSDATNITEPDPGETITELGRGISQHPRKGRASGSNSLSQRITVRGDEGEFTEIIIDEESGIPENGRGVKADDVVQVTSSKRSDSSSRTELRRNSIATVRMKLSVGEFESQTMIERTVFLDMRELNVGRYLIKRKSKRLALVGELTSIQFEVIRVPSPMERSGYLSEVGLLDYEIDCASTEWLIVGPRRAQFVASDDAVILCAQAIPLISGRAKLPLLKLFDWDGTEVASSRIDLDDEGLQVVVVGECRTTRTCKSTSLRNRAVEIYGSAAAAAAHTPGAQSWEGNVSLPALPAVLPSDLFFET